MALILDTGPVLAGLDADDPDHGRCCALIEESREDLVIPVCVLVELDYWVHKRLDPSVWTALTSDIARGAYRLAPMTVADVVRASELQARYADLDLGLVDASVIALAERTGETKLATLDRRDFSVVRPAHCEALRLLPD
jgi:uncharacterized protein